MKGMSTSTIKEPEVHQKHFTRSYHASYDAEGHWAVRENRNSVIDDKVHGIFTIVNGARR